MSTKESELFEATADYIEEHGWIQYQYRNAAGATCAAEGLYVAAGHELDLYSRAMARLTSVVGTSVTNWNDQPERTKQEVLDMLRAQAKAARQEEEALAA